jgi:hypothetical protein
MAGGNWDASQNINFGTWQVEWPQGPRTDDPGFQPRRFEAWVWQSSTGASQWTIQTGQWAPGRWTADGIPPGWKNGSFQDGPAVGLALGVWHNGGTSTDEYYWWVDAVDLY